MISTTTIQQVTVYADRAQLVRKGSAKLKEGVNTVVVEKLSPALLANSLQAKILGDAQLKELKHYRKAAIPPENTPLKEELKIVRGQKQALEHKIALFEKEQEYLSQLMQALSAPNEEAGMLHFDLKKWTDTLEYNRSKQLELDEELRQLHHEVEQKARLEAELVEKNNDVEWNVYENEIHMVELWIESAREQEVDFEVSYLAHGASWQPQYDIRIIPNEKKIHISYNAIIRQNTHENWNDVQLQLSTANVSEKGFLPRLETQRIHLESEDKLNEDYLHLQESIMSQKEEMPRKVAKSVARAPKEARPAPSHKVDNFLTTVNFAAAEQTSVESSTETHKKVSIVEMEFPVEFKYSSVPKLSSYAYLKAHLKNTSDYPLLSGESNVFLDNSFVTSSRVVLTQPQDETWVFLGVDETVKIERRLLHKKKDKGGFMKKNKVNLRYRIKVTNTQSKDISVSVWEPIPLSEDKSLVVELQHPKISKSQQGVELNDKSFLAWDIALSAQEKQELDVEYTIEYPLNYSVEGLGVEL